jgi:hypothetical protein
VPDSCLREWTGNMHRTRSKGAHVDLGLTGTNAISGSQDLMAWIASPEHGEDRFTRRPSLDVDNGMHCLPIAPASIGLQHRSCTLQKVPATLT